jgi:hypothetical protein
MLFIFIIILVLLGFSALSLMNLSKKTKAILSENHVSVVYARDMTGNLINLNQEISGCFVTGRNVDTLLVKNEFKSLDKTIALELNNITEVGEDALAGNIKNEINEYRELFNQYILTPGQAETFLQLQKKFGSLYRNLEVLSKMNEKAIEVKTEDAKNSAKKASTQMTVIGSLCFLITLSFIYSFASYFNERFSQLYEGIKEIVSSNYGQRLYFDGSDEFYEISLLFNEMAEKLEGQSKKMSVISPEDFENGENYNDIQELKDTLLRIKAIELQAKEVISRFEKSS